MIDRQLELGLNRAQGIRAHTRNQRRISKARWWFDRMHEVVNHASDWKPAAPSRPEQGYLELAETKRGA
jgi:hypothetical protein